MFAQRDGQPASVIVAVSNNHGSLHSDRFFKAKEHPDLLQMKLKYLTPLAVLAFVAPALADNPTAP